MVHAHLSLARPALLGFVRAYLWQLERTGALTVSTEVEQRAAQEAAEALYAAASDRDQRSRLFGEFRQLVEQQVSTPSPALQAVIARLVPAVETASVESVSIETTSVESAPVETTSVESVSVETASVESVPIETTSVESVSVETASVESVSVETASVESVSVETASASVIADDVPLVERSGELPAPEASTEETEAAGDESVAAKELAAHSVSRRRRERR